MCSVLFAENLLHQICLCSWANLSPSLASTSPSVRKQAELAELTHTLGGSKAKVPAPCSPCWLASPSPAGRNILNSVKNNKHGLININRPSQCQKEKREDCALLAGASLDQGATASFLIIWRQPACSSGPAQGPGQAEARPGPGGANH